MRRRRFQPLLHPQYRHLRDGGGTDARDGSPGVEKKDVNVQLENGVLRVEGRIDFSKYEGLDRSTPSTTSVTMRARSPSRTRSTRAASAPSSPTAS